MFTTSSVRFPPPEPEKHESEVVFNFVEGVEVSPLIIGSITESEAVTGIVTTLKKLWATNPDTQAVAAERVVQIALGRYRHDRGIDED